MWLLAAAENFWSFYNFDGGLCMGLAMGLTYIIVQDCRWRKSYNSLVKKNHELCDKIEALEAKEL